MALGFCAAFAFCGESPPSEERTIFGRAFGANYTIRVYGGGPHLEERPLRAAIDAEIARFEASISNWNDQSEVMRFNRLSSGQSMRIGPEFAAVYRESQRLYQLSRGAFDPGRSVLFDRWGFGPQGEQSSAPDAAEITKLVEESGIGRTRLRGDRLWKQGAHAELNFSALAAGLVVDRMTATLQRRGATAALVEISGELRAFGAPPGESGWRVGVEIPRFDGSREIGPTILLRDQATATSGNYRNFRELNGRRVGHILDPRHGRPTETAVASATVVGPLCVRADALATTLVVLGEEDGIKLIEATPGYEALLFVADGNGELRMVHSRGWPALLAAN